MLFWAVEADGLIILDEETYLLFWLDGHPILVMLGEITSLSLKSSPGIWNSNMLLLLFLLMIYVRVMGTWQISDFWSILYKICALEYQNHNEHELKLFRCLITSKMGTQPGCDYIDQISEMDRRIVKIHYSCIDLNNCRKATHACTCACCFPN